MNLTHIKKIIFILGLGIVASPLYVSAQAVVGGATTFSGETPSTSDIPATCEIISAEFYPSTDASVTTQSMEGYYKSNQTKLILITINTKNCARQKIYVSLMEKDSGVSLNIIDALAGDDVVTALNKKELTIDDTESVVISLQAGESECETSSTIKVGSVYPDCVYYLHIENSAGGTFDTMREDLTFKHAGMLAYECDISDVAGTVITVITAGTSSGCSDDWAYKGDTSLKTNPDGTILEEKASLVDPDSACKDDPDCYELFAGFGQALGEKYATVKPSNLGDFINMLIMFATGIVGIILIVRIIMLGIEIIQSKRKGKVVTLSDTKEELFKAIGGFILLLCIFLILRTINPDLLNLTPRIDALSLDTIALRANDEAFNEAVNSIDAANVSVDTSDYEDQTFLMYLYHQQGPGGAPSILWAAKRGMSSIPADTPFIKGSALKINSNMAGNINKTDMQKVIGTSSVTPVNFLAYWRKKVEAAKQSTNTIPSEVQTALTDVSNELNINKTSLTAMCRIESGCNTKGITVVNNLGYSGLFQLSKTVFQEYKKSGGNILDAYSNIYAGGRYALDNLKTYNKNKSKIGF